MAEKCKATIFSEFLMSISTASGEIHIIIDKAKYHNAILMKEFLDAKPHLILEFLPLYSHELNSIEIVWKIIS